MQRTFLAAVAASLSLAHAAAAHDFTLGDLVIQHPMAFETPKTAQTAGAYLTIVNTGDQDDRIIAVEGDFPKISLHTTEFTDDIARMGDVDGIDVPAGATVALQPGGYHIMFMGLAGDPFEIGEKIPATLVFERAGKVQVVFNVESRNPDATGSATDHSGHDMGEGAHADGHGDHKMSH